LLPVGLFAFIGIAASPLCILCSSLWSD